MTIESFTLFWSILYANEIVICNCKKPKSFVDSLVVVSTGVVIVEAVVEVSEKVVGSVVDCEPNKTNKY